MTRLCRLSCSGVTLIFSKKCEYLIISKVEGRPSKHSQKMKLCGFVSTFINVSPQEVLARINHDDKPSEMFQNPRHAFIVTCRKAASMVSMTQMWVHQSSAGAPIRTRFCIRRACVKFRHTPEKRTTSQWCQVSLAGHGSGDKWRPPFIGKVRYGCRAGVRVKVAWSEQVQQTTT